MQIAVWRDLFAMYHTGGKDDDASLVRKDAAKRLDELQEQLQVQAGYTRPAQGTADAGPGRQKRRFSSRAEWAAHMRGER